MKKENENENISGKDLQDKLDKIIEQSRSENSALKKILLGLEKMNSKPDKNKKR